MFDVDDYTVGMNARARCRYRKVHGNNETALCYRLYGNQTLREDCIANRHLVAHDWCVWWRRLLRDVRDAFTTIGECITEGC